MVKYLIYRTLIIGRVKLFKFNAMLNLNLLNNMFTTSFHIVHHFDCNLTNYGMSTIILYFEEYFPKIHNYFTSLYKMDYERTSIKASKSNILISFL